MTVLLIFDVRTREPVLTLPDMHSLAINTVRWQPNVEESSSLLLSSSFDCKINLYDIRNPDKVLHTLEKHVTRGRRANTIIHPCFYFDGNIILTYAEQSPLLWLYRVDGEFVKTIDIEAPISYLCTQPTLNKVAICSSTRIGLLRYKPK
jgi:WD40 repeat protein